MTNRGRPARRSLVLMAAAIAAWSGCGTADVAVLSLTPGADASAIAAPDGAIATIDTHTQYCSGSGPPLLIDAFAEGGAATMCPDELAQRAFLYALCTCQNYVSTHALATDAFDGSHGAYDPSTATAGGSVGVNGALQSNGTMQVGGSLWASNATDINFTAPLTVSGDLHAGGELRPTTLNVGGAAWLAGGIQTTGNGSVTIGGAVHIPAGAPGASSFATPVTTPFQVTPACDCDASQFVDVAGVVATYEAHNDDAALGIDPNLLQNVQAPVTRTLDCGRIFFTSIAANQAPIHLTVTSHVAIFVGGDISTDDFEIDVPPGGDFDLFVAGTIDVRGSFLVGNSTNPARARTYVGGNSVNLESAATLAGNLYAPNARITVGASASTTLFGAIFAASLSAGADLAIHYDQAILTQSSACLAPEACTTCADCGGQACNSGTCGSCVDSSQCCAPLVCGSQGTCVDVVAP